MKNAIAFYYMPLVECDRDRNRPLRIDNAGVSPSGVSTYTITDKRTGKTFRDGAAITADFARLAAATKIPRAGAAAFAVPAELRSVSPQSILYVTAKQRASAESLRREMRAWQHLLASSKRVIASADMEPNTVARQTTEKEYGLRMTLTTVGAKKLRTVMEKHRREILAVVLDPDQPTSRLYMAPNMMEPIASTQFETSGFATLAAAQKMADHLNGR